MSNVEAWLKSTAAKQRDVAKGVKSQTNWLNSSEQKQCIAAAKAQAISEFKKRFPRADISRFQVEVEVDANHKVTGTVLFTESDGSQMDPLIKDRKYWSQGLRDALGFHQDGVFPYQLSPLIGNKPQPVPAVDSFDNITQSMADFFNKEMKIYVTPTDYFTMKFREIFTKAQIKVTTLKYARKWLAKPDMSFWEQQLNFALWCATTACGVSREMLFPSSLNLSEQIQSFYQFHVYYTTRKILYEMGGFRVSMLCLTIRSLNRETIPMMLQPTKVSVQNLALIQVMISALHMGKTMG